MGAGQIGGFATLLDIDFQNAAGFAGEPAETTEGHFVVFFMSHALLFCTGILIESNVVLTPAICVFGERYKFDVFGGTHYFLENAGVSREADDICVHQEFNKTKCFENNIALIVLDKQFGVRKREHNTEFAIHRARYTSRTAADLTKNHDERITCTMFGWGSRRNGYLVPLLLKLRRVDFTLLPEKKCDPIWSANGTFLCLGTPPCKTEKYGALCPDDVGSVVLCNGYAQGMMGLRIVDRPCGVGFTDLGLYHKFLTCGVDDSRDVANSDQNNILNMDEESSQDTTPVVNVVDLL